MIKHYPKKSLGYANHGWLKSNHHFSFANYYNPQRMNFGALRVVNDDIVVPGTGFDTHPHRNMEIISYVRSGAITHKDSEGNKGVTKTGDVQVMSAGSGIFHSEYNLSDEPLSFYQIWIDTKDHNIKPRWQTKPFPKGTALNELPLLVSGFSEDKGKALEINQNARIYGGRIKKGQVIEHKLLNQGYILASNGNFDIITHKPANRQVMQTGDGAEVTGIKQLTFKANTDAEILVIDVPA